MSKNFVEIHSTLNYDMFQLFPRNRAICEKHVKSFMEDPTFPMGFRSCPIVVNSDMFIVDGQHRCTAAKRLEIPVFYVVDANATEQDIQKRNSTTKGWVLRDHVIYHSHDKPTYAFIVRMMKEHSVSVSFINSMAMKITGKSNRTFNKDLRDGKINLEAHLDDMEKFLSVYVPRIREYKKLRAKDCNEGTFLFMDCYIQAFSHYFKYDRVIFEKALSNLITSNLPLTYTTIYEEARKFVVNLSEWTPPSKAKKAK